MTFRGVEHDEVVSQVARTISSGLLRGWISCGMKLGLSAAFEKGVVAEGWMERDFKA